MASSVPIHTRSSSNINQAVTLSVLNIQFLPPEIHFLIAQYVHRDDLPNYRLASKLLAEAGQPELFHTLILRATLANVSGFNHIRQNERLSKLVRTLIWDTNALRVGPNVRDWHEWTRHCEARAEKVAPDQAVLYKELAAGRQLWVAYLSRLQEEKKALQKIKALFYRQPYPGLELPNLQVIHVVRGAYQVKNWQVCKTRELDMLPVTTPLSTWRGDSLSQSCPVDLSTCIAMAAPKARKLRIDGLMRTELNLVSISSQHVNEKSKLTSISIRLSNRHPMSSLELMKDWLAPFLAQWCYLESIYLDLGHLAGPIQTIDDTFEVPYNPDFPRYTEGPVTWPALRKLSLCHFYSSPKALLSLVNRHCSTLRDLRLHAMQLIPIELEISTQHSWRDIFQVISVTTNLENVVLSGVFRNSDDEDDVWDFDDEHLAGDVAKWIINGGDWLLENKHNTVRESLG